MVVAINMQCRRRIRDGNCRCAGSVIINDAGLIQSTASMRAIRSLRQAHWVIRRARPIKDICPARIKSKALRSNSRIIN